MVPSRLTPPFSISKLSPPQDLVLSLPHRILLHSPSTHPLPTWPTAQPWAWSLKMKQTFLLPSPLGSSIILLSNKTYNPHFSLSILIICIWLLSPTHLQVKSSSQGYQWLWKHSNQSLFSGPTLQDPSVCCFWPCWPLLQISCLLENHSACESNFLLLSCLLPTPTFGCQCPLELCTQIPLPPTHSWSSMIPRQLRHNLTKTYLLFSLSTPSLISSFWLVIFPNIIIHLGGPKQPGRYPLSLTSLSLPHNQPVFLCPCVISTPPISFSLLFLQPSLSPPSLSTLLSSSTSLWLGLFQMILYLQLLPASNLPYTPLPRQN